MRRLWGMLPIGRWGGELRRSSQLGHVSCRLVSGVVCAVSVLALWGGPAFAQQGRFSVSDANETARMPRAASTSVQPAFVPQPLMPISSGPSSLYQQPVMPIASSYGSGMGVHPAAYYGPPDPPGMMPDEMMSGGFEVGGPCCDPCGYGRGGCHHCGGAGCGFCSGHGNGMFGGFLSGLLPYTEGGSCAPRWYDIAVDAMYWTRDEVSSFVPFTSFTRFGPTIMSSDSVDYEERPGFRFNAALQVFAGVNLEFGYFGLFNWSADTTVTSPVGDELFSPYSDFGALVGVGSPFDESDQAQQHSLRVSSTIDNFELNVRKYWTGPNCRLQGSYKSGVRYIYLVDDMNFSTLGRNVVVGLGTAPAGESSNDVRTHNSLIGFQSGFELWANIVPGVSVGTDCKAGVYGNFAKQNTFVTGSTTSAGSTANLNESATNNDVAVAGEANVMFLYRCDENLTLRAGYSVFFIDGVALATENFNSENPFNNIRAVPELDDDGHVFYHGGFAGFEWMW